MYEWEDPRRKWLQDMSPSVLERVSKQPEGKRRTWLARGDVRAASHSRRQKLLDEAMKPMQMRQQFMQNQMPLGDREKMAMQQQHDISMQRGRQDFTTSQGDLGFRRDLLRDEMTFGRKTEEADRVHGRGREDELVDATRDRRWRLEDRVPQYDLYQRGPEGQQFYFERGSDIPADMHRVSPTSFETNINLPKAGPSAMLNEMSGLFDLQKKVGYLKGLVVPGQGGEDAAVLDEVGPMANWWETTKEKYNVPFASRPTGEGVQLRQVSNSLANYLLNLLSGAAINKDEYTRLVKALPQPNMQPDVFQYRLNNFEIELNDIIETKQMILGQSGYIVPGQEQEPTDQQLFEILRRGQ